MATSLAYVKERRGMPFLKRGMRVEVDGKSGIVTSGNSSGNINVRFDGLTHSINCHPHWRTKYFDKDDSIIADYTEKTDAVN